MSFNTEELYDASLKNLCMIKLYFSSNCQFNKSIFMYLTKIGLVILIILKVIDWAGRSAQSGITREISAPD